jgi:hypothetical protein
MNGPNSRAMRISMTPNIGFQVHRNLLQSSATPSDARIPVARSIRAKTKEAVS